MKEIVEIVLEKFEGLIKRSFMPSASFVFMFLLFDLYQNDALFISFLDKEHPTLMIITIIIGFTALSTFLTILNQLIYDNRIKSNFNSQCKFIKENSDLNTYKENIQKKLELEGATDYILYQKLKQKMTEKERDILKRYTDETKTIGIFFASLLLIIIISLSTYLAEVNLFFSLKNATYFMGTLLLLVFFYKVGKELILAKYRSRAMKIYINFLEFS